METVLVINAGSSSIKMSLYIVARHAELTVALRGQIEGIATAQPRLSLKRSDGTPLVDSAVHPGDAADHRGAMTVFASALAGSPPRAAIDAVGHRVVHGGVMHSNPVVVDDDVMRSLETLVTLAPLHQPHNLAAIRAVAERLSGVPQVACFDTAFHRAHPKIADAYALPWDLYERGVRRYGFHGLSYEYVASVLPPEIASGRVVVAHLGSGASMCALRAGQSMDSTMGFTAVDGLPRRPAPISATTSEPSSPTLRLRWGDGRPCGLSRTGSRHSSMSPRIPISRMCGCFWRRGGIIPRRRGPLRAQSVACACSSSSGSGRGRRTGSEPD